MFAGAQGYPQVSHVAPHSNFPDKKGDIFGSDDYSSSLQAPHPTCRIVHVSGKQDEITVIAKEILGLVRDRQMEFHDIGVVGRTLSDYELVLPREFGRHGIPFVSTMTRNLSAFPFVKTAIQLLDLPISDYRREQVLELFYSPFFRIEGVCPDLVHLQIDKWDLLSRRLGIVKGLQDWERIPRGGEARGFLPEEDENTTSGIPDDNQPLLALWRTVLALHEVMSTVPEFGTWEDYVQAVITLFRRLLCVPERAVDQRQDSQLPPLEAIQANEDMGLSINHAVLEEHLEELRALHHSDIRVSYGYFFDAFCRLMDASSVPLVDEVTTPKNTSAVQVLDAMSARGVRFRMLFVIGLTENVFPRSIQEDPFLRDHLRRQFELNLGFKIPEKLAGYEEEQLLFYLLINSVTQSLTLLYQRSDQYGRSQLPSPYLDEVRLCMGNPADMRVPRRFQEKCETLPIFGPDRLTQQEHFLKHVLARQLPSQIAVSSYPTGQILESGLRFFGKGREPTSEIRSL